MSEEGLILRRGGGAQQVGAVREEGGLPCGGGWLAEVVIIIPQLGPMMDVFD